MIMKDRCPGESFYESIFDAVKMNDAKALEAFLIFGTEINCRDEGGRTPLHWAVIGGSSEAAAFLIAHGADLEARGDDGQTPLEIAFDRGDNEIVDLLLQAGAELD
jgi:ankyrin repeat protein